MIDPVLALIARGLLLLLFGNSLTHKVRDVGAFRRAIWAYRLLPEALVIPAGPILIALEFAAVAALLAVNVPWLGATAVVLLLGVYSGAIFVNLLRGFTDVDCGCGGDELDRKLSWGLMLRNAAFAALAMVTALPSDARPLLWVDGLSVLGFLGLALVWRSTYHQLVKVGQGQARSRPSEVGA